MVKCEEDNIENCQIHDWESEKREEKCTKGNEGDSSDVGSWKKVYWRCELDESINMSLVGRRELFIRISILGMKFKENLTVNHSIHWPWNYVVSHSFWKPFLIIQFFMPVISSDENVLNFSQKSIFHVHIKLYTLTEILTFLVFIFTKIRWTLFLIFLFIYSLIAGNSLRKPNGDSSTSASSTYER